MSTNPFQAAEALVMTVRSSALDDNYKAIASLYDEIPLLKGQIEPKSKEVDDPREENVSLETRYENYLRKHLEIYCTTLQHRARGRPSREEKAQGQQYLKPYKEEVIVKHLLQMSSLGYPIRMKFIPSRRSGIIITRNFRC